MWTYLKIYTCHRSHTQTHKSYGCLKVWQIVKRMKRSKSYNEHVSFTIIREHLLVKMDLIIKHNKQRECKRKEKKWILRMQKVDLLRRGEFTSSPPRGCWGYHSTSGLMDDVDLHSSGIPHHDAHPLRTCVCLKPGPIRNIHI